MDLDKLRLQEDEAVKLVDAMPLSMKLTVYELLNRGHGISIQNIESERIRAFRKESEGK
jgi:hypothetical protein